MLGTLLVRRPPCAADSAQICGSPASPPSFCTRPGWGEGGKEVLLRPPRGICRTLRPCRLLGDRRQGAGSPEHRGCVWWVSGELTAMILERDEAVERWRKAIGPTDAAAARETAPESLRAKYGTDKTRNALHGSDSRESAALEIAQLFPNRTAAARGDDRGGGAVAAAMAERLARLPRADALAELSLLASALGGEIAEAVQAAAAAHDRAPRSDRSEL